MGARRRMACMGEFRPLASGAAAKVGQLSEASGARLADARAVPAIQHGTSLPKIEAGLDTSVPGSCHSAFFSRKQGAKDRHRPAHSLTRTSAPSPGPLPGRPRRARRACAARGGPFPARLCGRPRRGSPRAISSRYSVWVSETPLRVSASRRRKAVSTLEREVAARRPACRSAVRRASRVPPTGLPSGGPAVSPVSAVSPEPAPVPPAAPWVEAADPEVTAPGVHPHRHAAAGGGRVQAGPAGPRLDARRRQQDRGAQRGAQESSSHLHLAASPVLAALMVSVRRAPAASIARAGRASRRRTPIVAAAAARRRRSRSGRRPLRRRGRGGPGRPDRGRGPARRPTP